MEICNYQERFQGKSKVEKFGWTVIDAPGKYLMIRKNKLKVNKQYQRPVNNRFALQIAAKWSWVSCGTLAVVNSNGEYFIIDGQHRKIAADKRDDIRDLPCIVYELDGLKEEAEVFLTINKNRKRLSRFDELNPKYIIGDECIVELSELLEESDCRFSTSRGPGTVSFLASLEKSYATNSNLTKSLWPLYLESQKGEILDGNIWTGLFYIYRQHPIEPNDIEKLQKAGKLKILQSINKAKAFYNKGGERTNAMGILQILNHGKAEKNRIDLK